MYFELTDNKIVKNNMTLTQIKAIKDFPQFDIVAGTLGGWISEKAQIANNGKVWIGEIATVYGGNFNGGNFNGGNFYGGYFNGGNFNGGNFNGGYFYGGNFNGGYFYGGDFYGGDFNGGNFKGGYFKGGDFNGGNFNGGYFYGGDFKGGNFNGGFFKGGDFNGGNFNGGIFKGGNFNGGIFKGGLIPQGFGNVPFINCEPYQINFAGWIDSIPYFSCGCQHYSLDKWNDETFRKNLAKEHNISEKDLKSLESGFTYIQTLI